MPSPGPGNGVDDVRFGDAQIGQLVTHRIGGRNARRRENDASVYYLNLEVSRHSVATKRLQGAFGQG